MCILLHFVGFLNLVRTCCTQETVTCHTRLTVLCRLLARAQCVIVSEVPSVCSTINMPRDCVNSSDAFCYICGELTFKSRRGSFPPLIKKRYEHYFGCKVGDQDKSWAPNFCCVTCARLLAAWAKGSHCMPFAIPMVWREPTDHVSDGYFSLTSVTGVKAKSKHTVKYPNLASALRSIPHNAELPAPKPPTNMMLSDSESSDEDISQADKNMDCDPTFAGACSSNEPYLLTQGDLNNVVHNMNLSKKQAVLLGSRLKFWSLLHQGTKVCFTVGTMKNSRISSRW